MSSISGFYLSVSTPMSGEYTYTEYYYYYYYYYLLEIAGNRRTCMTLQTVNK